MRLDGSPVAVEAAPGGFQPVVKGATVLGLDTSHDCFHGAYSRFHRFRLAVGRAAGFKETPDGYFDLGVDPNDEGALYGDWQSAPDDPILVLLAHSDCEGHILANHAAHVATRLEQLLPDLDAEAVEIAGQFIAGLRLAAEYGEPVEFH